MTRGAPAQGWYALFPLSNATTNANIIGWTGLVGGTLFEIGAYCMVVEALNRGNAVRFGYEVMPPVTPSAVSLGLPQAGYSGKAPLCNDAIKASCVCQGLKQPYGAQVRHLMEAGLTHFHRTRSRDADFYGPNGAAVGQVEHVMHVFVLQGPLTVFFTPLCCLMMTTTKGDCRHADQ